MNIDDFVYKYKRGGKYITFEQFTREEGNFPFQVNAERSVVIVAKGDERLTFVTLDTALATEEREIENAQAKIKKAKNDIEYLERLKYS